MNKYKVMLVDDEEEVRSAIARKVNWEELGFILSVEAENGEDAIEKAEKYMPDVVMTDIHMPFMDGLTFCKKLKEAFPATRIVIFSGYDEFEYAKEAISLEVEEYLLKPVDAEDIKRVFQKIKERLDEEFDKRLNIEKLEKYYQESLPVLKDQLLIGLLEGRISEKSVEMYKKDYQLSFEAPFYAVGILKFDDLYDESTEGLKANLLSVSLKQMADERFLDQLNYYSINYLGTVVIVAFLKNTREHSRFVTIMDQICKLSNKMINANIVAGIGKVYGNIRDISYSFAEAKDATMYKILLDSNQAIFIGDVEPKSDDNFFLDEKQIEQIIKEIKIGTKESLTNAVNVLIMRMKNSTITLSQLQLFFAEIVIEIIRLAKNYDVSLKIINLYSLDIYNEIKKLSSLEAFGDWILSICMELMDGIHKERMDSAKLLAEKTKEYIASNYNDSTLSIDKVCSYLGVSATYFSSVFKKETGLSFVAYLTNVRMEEALNLLQTTEEKSYVIAGKVGYEEPNYFSYVFKKQYGVSPSKYRQKA